MSRQFGNLMTAILSICLVESALMNSMHVCESIVNKWWNRTKFQSFIYHKPSEEFWLIESDQLYRIPATEEFLVTQRLTLGERSSGRWLDTESDSVDIGSGVPLVLVKHNTIQHLVNSGGQRLLYLNIMTLSAGLVVYSVLLEPSMTLHYVLYRFNTTVDDDDGGGGGHVVDLRTNLHWLSQHKIPATLITGEFNMNQTSQPPNSHRHSVGYEFSNSGTDSGSIQIQDLYVESPFDRNSIDQPEKSDWKSTAERTFTNRCHYHLYVSELVNMLVLVPVQASTNSGPSTVNPLTNGDGEVRGHYLRTLPLGFIYRNNVILLDMERQMVYSFRYRTLGENCFNPNRTDNIHDHQHGTGRRRHHPKKLNKIKFFIESIEFGDFFDCSMAKNLKGELIMAKKSTKWLVEVVIIGGILVLLVAFFGWILARKNRYLQTISLSSGGVRYWRMLVIGGKEEQQRGGGRRRTIKRRKQPNRTKTMNDDYDEPSKCSQLMANNMHKLTNTDHHNNIVHENIDENNDQDIDDHDDSVTSVITDHNYEEQVDR